MKYCGIADAHGIESFISYQTINPKVLKSIAKMQDTPIESDHTLFAMKMRAGANRHRHTVMYLVEMEDKDAKKIEKLLSAEKYIDALKQLKILAKETSVEKGREKSWSMIPNEDLDPYAGERGQ